MDILIRGMEMPETCKLCYLSEFDPGFYAYVCKPTGIRIDCDMAKIDRPRRICPLVPVPPHGDLIDRDALISNHAIDQYDWSEVIDVEDIRNAPAIIEASE